MTAAELSIERLRPITSFDVSLRLYEAGFKYRYDASWVEYPDGSIHLGIEDIFLPTAREYAAYRLDTLQMWMMTSPIFSNRAMTVEVDWRTFEGEKGKYEPRFIVRAFGSDNIVFKFSAVNPVDAYGEVVLKMMEGAA